MNKHREALRYFRLELTDEFLNYQKDAPDGMFDELNKNISLLNEAILKAEKVDEIEEEIGCPLEVVVKALEIIKPLCEAVETPVKKIRYLKINGVVVYTFKKKAEYDLFKKVLKDEN